MLVLKPVVFFQDLSKGGSGPSINPFSTLIQLNSQGQHWKHRCPDLLLHSHLQLTQKSPQTSPKTQSLPVRHSHSSLTYRQDPKILGIPPHKSASPPQPRVCALYFTAVIHVIPAHSTPTCKLPQCKLGVSWSQQEQIIIIIRITLTILKMSSCPCSMHRETAVKTTEAAPKHRIQQWGHGANKSTSIKGIGGVDQTTSRYMRGESILKKESVVLQLKWAQEPSVYYLTLYIYSYNVPLRRTTVLFLEKRDLDPSQIHIQPRSCLQRNFFKARSPFFEPFTDFSWRKCKWWHITPRNE